MKTGKVDLLTIQQYDSRAAMGSAAASAVVRELQSLQQKQETVNIVFAAAPSQNEFLEALVHTPGIDWTRINAFHMDEYIGLPDDAPQRFGNFLKERIFGKLPFRSVNYLNGNAADVRQECERYTQLLRQHPVDIVCMGIGENCHIAFNDPHVADFNDPAWVKVVDLDEACRQQQVNDGCFPMIRSVPTHALTLTIPALMAATFIFCVVPGANKATAVRHTLTAAVHAMYPSTVLRTHGNAVLFVDGDSASEVQL
ncbi:glucosamine-6-phosphate deaminase [Parapedobacter composti]|uniref:Glucosamine-6-phosphate deaminase n=1 Tax=Parapedobacter composti TaxID=623281 RepID=A0A1I1E5R6_9SPHI|nr:glucosamine-6-phosphate deaminase [Parapedobacter composti]SFB82417.1 glucosamine-6-phosphate deaminase [Parapedobacter composti]